MHKKNIKQFLLLLLLRCCGDLFALSLVKPKNICEASKRWHHDMNTVCLWPDCCYPIHEGVKFPCNQCEYSPSPQSSYSTILAQTRTGDRLSLEWWQMATPSVGFKPLGPAPSGKHFLSLWWTLGVLSRTLASWLSPLCLLPASQQWQVGGERRVRPGLAPVTRDTAWVRPVSGDNFWLLCHEMAIHYSVKPPV